MQTWNVLDNPENMCMLLSKFPGGTRDKCSVRVPLIRRKQGNETWARWFYWLWEWWEPDSQRQQYTLLGYFGVFVHFCPLLPPSPAHLPWDIFELGSIKAFWTMSSFYVSKYFLRYILTENVSKNFKLYQVSKCPNISILQILKTLLSKNRFYFFFLIFWHAKIPPSFRMPHYWNWFLTYAKQKVW